ncbi:MAG: pilus assembly PilX N-terminal domain-containing protein [Syntrophobacteraceae bacterium]
MMRALNNEKGLALISTLMLVVLGLGVVATLLRLVTMETKLARLEQNYSTALDSAKGGADTFIFLIQNGIALPPNPGIGTGNETPHHSGHCLKVKMNNPTSSWYAAAEWTANGCPTLDSGAATNPNPTVEPDVTLWLSGYKVDFKVVDTSETVGHIPPLPPPCQDGCYYYTVNIRSQAPGTNERADITFVYRYDK